MYSRRLLGQMGWSGWSRDNRWRLRFDWRGRLLSRRRRKLCGNVRQTIDIHSNASSSGQCKLGQKTGAARQSCKTDVRCEGFEGRTQYLDWFAALEQQRQVLGPKSTEL